MRNFVMQKYRHSSSLQLTQPHQPIRDWQPRPRPVDAQQPRSQRVVVVKRPVSGRSANNRLLAQPRKMRPPAQLRQSRRTAKRQSRQYSPGRILLWGVVTPVLALITLVLLTAVVMAVSFTLFYGDRMFPRVAVGGVPVGGLTYDDAAQVVAAEWDTIRLSDGERSWSVEAATLGLTVDTLATVERAFAQGRNRDTRLAGLFQPVDVLPIVTVYREQSESALQDLMAEFEVPPVNAGIRFVGGTAVATPPVDGYTLNLPATLARLTESAFLSSGELELVMTPVSPSVVDVGPLVATAQTLLDAGLSIHVFDPVTGDSVQWEPAATMWAEWLVVDNEVNSQFSVDEAAVMGYVEAQASTVFDSSRYLKADEVSASIRATVEAGSPGGLARVYHHDRVHTVQAGESVISIAWDYGVPYPWIQEANPGVGALSAGQHITIPSPDNFMELPVVPDKRIVISISQQHAWVYEAGAVKWDWTISTGIADSPTWPGIYQIISHVPNAYAANWDLYMPSFMGVYRPIPGAAFTNGFHGFPTRGGSQLLWTNSLGRRVTYGCILLSNQNAQLLYDWAEDGVVVEIQA